MDKDAMIFNTEETSEPANSSYTRTHQVNVNRFTADNNGDTQLAECLTISTLGTYDLNVMKNVDARFKWLNGIGADSPAFEFLNDITFPEMLRLMDEEVRPFRATPAAIGLDSEAKNASDGCIWHPGSDHSNAECKAQMRTAGPPGSAKAKAPMVCFTCQQPGHHKRQCPSTATAKAAKTKPATKTKKVSAHAAADIAAITTAVMAALEARPAALDSADQGSDTLSGHELLRSLHSLSSPSLVSASTPLPTGTYSTISSSLSRVVFDDSKCPSPSKVWAAESSRG